MRWDPPADPKDLVLERVKGVLEMRGPTDAPGSGVHVDLGRVKRQGMRNTPLARALGKCVTVVDATAGLGGDAMLMALLGCDVTAIEQSPLLVQLLRDGLERAAADTQVAQEAIARLRVLEGDSQAVLSTLPQPEAILLDPMFPARRKASALASKEIRLVGAAAAAHASNEQALFAAATAHATRRVLVKRADDSQPLDIARKPDLSFSGRTSRIDVYLSTPQKNP